ncbi:MAG: hypothetical protein AUH30_19665 [Candidatus Rokubacteria bacterium 13_1_40CM_68_15]|nr:MAG: hypothetical protein AUH30_19665 [Candidatus Rokubacteria bacterium 13_1_40CM_68_15]
MIGADRWRELRRDWAVLSHYQRFESSVAFALTVIVGAIIVVALFRLIVNVTAGLVLGALDPLDHSVFQSVFGDVLTLLIALEFNHTLQYVVARQQSIIQTRVVFLIALLALARKFIIFDLRDMSPGHLLGLAAVTLSLGVTYWLMCDRADRSPTT